VPHKRQEAIEYLKQACDLEPSTGFEKFMYLGQVLDACGRAREAEAAMRTGVEILRRENDAQNSNGEFLTSALCSLAELLMGLIHDDDDMMDACYASASALPELSEVEALLEQAITSSSGKSPEPLQGMCGLRVLQGREEEALELLKASLTLWRSDGDDKAGGETGEGGVHGDDDESDDASHGGEEIDEENDPSSQPSYEFRFETAKLLLELDVTTETAAEILEELLEENDMVPDVWLLLAVAYRAGGDEESAREAAVNGVRVAQAAGERREDNEVVFALEELVKEFSSDDL
jgi:tetratricopeptide (TPR) repeat protein